MNKCFGVTKLQLSKMTQSRRILWIFQSLLNSAHCVSDWALLVCQLESVDKLRKVVDCSLSVTRNKFRMLTVFGSLYLYHRRRIHWYASLLSTPFVYCFKLWRWFLMCFLPHFLPNFPSNENWCQSVWLKMSSKHLYLPLLGRRYWCCRDHLVVLY